MGIVRRYSYRRNPKLIDSTVICYRMSTIKSGCLRKQRDLLIARPDQTIFRHEKL